MTEPAVPPDSASRAWTESGSVRALPRWQRVAETFGLRVHALALLLLLTTLVIAGAWLLSLAWRGGPHDLGPLEPWQAAALGAFVTGVLGAAATGWLLTRHSQQLARVTLAARQLRRNDIPDGENLPLLGGNLDTHELSRALHGLVAAQQAQRRALQDRIGELDVALERRTHALSTLQDLSLELAGKDDLMQLVDEALRALERTLDCSSASVWARETRARGEQVVLLGYRDADAGHPDEVSPMVGRRLSRANLTRYEAIERSRQPVTDNDTRQGLLSWLWEMVVDDASTSQLYRHTRSWMGLPLQVRDQVLGVLRVDHTQPGFFDAERSRLLGAVASQTALAMHHSQLLSQQRELAVVTERNRIARELHDAVSQTLFASNVITGTLVKLVDKGPDGDPKLIRQQAQTIEKLNRGALAEMRMLLFELRPDALQDQPLPTLLQHPIEALECRGDMTVDKRIAPGDPLEPSVRAQVYRIAQEALSNLARHAGARHASIAWQPDDPQGAVLTIADDGEGFDPEAATPGHFGLENMRSRAAEIGARLELSSAPGQGTQIRLVLPRPAGAATGQGIHAATPGPAPGRHEDEPRENPA